MAAVKLFGSKDRDESHRELERVLKEGIYPRASCREDTENPDEPFTVWSDGPEPFTRSDPPPPAITAIEDDRVLDRIADKLLDRIDARLKARAEA